MLCLRLFCGYHFVSESCHQTSNIWHTLVGNKFVDHSGVVGASSVSAAPTTSSFSCTWCYISRLRLYYSCCTLYNLSPPGQNGHHVGRRHFSNAFSWKKMIKFLFKFHWNLFPWVQLTISQHWFSKWLGAEQATSHLLNQWWPSLMTNIFVLGGDEIIECW